MRVLVSGASRHGATQEIARAIGDVLIEEGVEARVLPPDDVDDLTTYDAVVLGSAAYMGRWLIAGRELAARVSGQLNGRPVWLFSSGPVGDPPVPAPESAVDVSAIQSATGARAHRLFGGRLARKELGLGERVVAATLKVSDGDHRDWDEITAWARQIATELRAAAATDGSEQRR